MYKENTNLCGEKKKKKKTKTNIDGRGVRPTIMSKYYLVLLIRAPIVRKERRGSQDYDYDILS